MVRGKDARWVVAVVAIVALVVAAGAYVVRGSESEREGEKQVFASAREKLAEGEVDRDSPGGEANGGSGGESAEIRAAREQFDNARTAPSGIVAPGAYSSAFKALQGLPATGGAWDEITNVVYDADDPDYRDFYSNSSGGAGKVTGRVTGLAIGGGMVYAAGADGGVWRSASGSGDWQPIADGLPSLSSGDLQVDRSGALWYGTGEANTGGTSYVGSGVYRLADPASGTFSPSDRVGGNELESTTIYHLRFGGGRVYAATLRGVYAHSATGHWSDPWQRLFSPNPDSLPGGTNARAQNAAYQNIVNDIAVDPKNASHLIAAAGWRAGAAYNGFYESKDAGVRWTKINPGGAINPKDIGYATFAFAADGSKLYVVNESVKLYNQATGNNAANTLLDGIYVSNTGNPAGPWNKIADSQKLAAKGSALKQSVGGKGYGPGVQAWYNQFLAVDPKNADHVYAGLEEVYETQNAGSSWTTAAPYWNFNFACWRPDALYPPNGNVGCPLSPHSDQHSVAIGDVGGESFVYVGNDGGVYRRPVAGKLNANGNATDWQSVNDGTMDALQYYYVGVGKLTGNDAKRPDLGSGDPVLVSGGLQDNGGSLLRPRGAKMVSNFGGDGGDVLVDPDNGCNIVQEYVYLSMRVTNTCANPGNPDAFLDLSKATTRDIAPPDVNAQFIAPFTANETNPKQWLAAGTSIWYQDKGFDIQSGSEWQKAYTLPSADQTFTAITYSGDRALATWCGPCSNSGSAPFKRGAVVGTFTDGTWSFTPVSLPGDFPNRYLSGAAIDPADPDHLFLGVNGFSRRFTEGPGAEFGHVFESTNGGVDWSDGSGNLPDVPVNDIVALRSGGVVAATDLGVLYRKSGASDWQRLGKGLPTTTVMDLSVGPDENLYVATHGRGIWRIPVSGL